MAAADKVYENVKRALAAFGLIVKPSATAAESTSPSITSGTGAPTATEPNGSLYLRTNGDGSTTLYVRAGDAWAAQSAAAAGAANGTGVTAAVTPSGAIQVVLTLDDTPVVMADEAGVVAYGSLKVYDMPEGVLFFMGATADLALTLSAAGINADWDGDFGIGTAAAGNDATLSGTEEDLLPSTATPQAVASATTATGQSTATETGTVFDGTSTAVDVYLNILVDDADHDITTTPTNIICNGTITLTYAFLGDY